jgi:hypothetical protein
MVMKTSDAIVGLYWLSAELVKYINDTIRVLPAPMIDIPWSSFSGIIAQFQARL